MQARAATCTFTSNLEIGVESEAVRCLQQYLNANGFTVSDTGVGSKGKETNQYQTKTKAAVQKWQTANGISPATGTFGPISRAKYIVLTSAAPTPTVPAPQPTTPVIPTPKPTSSSEETSARNAILDARDAYEDAMDEYEDAKDDGDNVGKSKTMLAEADEQLTEALYAFVDEDYGDARDFADEAMDTIDEALDEMDGGTGDGGDEDEAEEAIEDAGRH